MTRFVVLSSTDSDPGWFEQGFQEAHSAEQAVKLAYLKAQDGSILQMVAVPARSWKPTPIRTETVQRVVLGDSPQASAPPPSPRSGPAPPEEQA